jgi:hypothetical protein
MAIITKSKLKKREIDLTGPQGNAFCLIGIARNWGKELGKDTKAITTEMMSGDYENLVCVFDREFGDICDLIR